MMPGRPSSRSKPVAYGDAMLSPAELTSQALASSNSMPDFGVPAALQASHSSSITASMRVYEPGGPFMHELHSESPIMPWAQALTPNSILPALLLPACSLRSLPSDVSCVVCPLLSIYSCASLLVDSAAKKESSS